MSRTHQALFEATYHGNDAGFKKWGVVQMHPLHRYRAALTKARVAALERSRALEAFASLGADRVLDAFQVARALRVTVDTARIRMANGQIRGACLERRQWRIRRSDLLAHMERELATRADVRAIDLVKEGS